MVITAEMDCLSELLRTIPLDVSRTDCAMLSAFASRETISNFRKSPATMVSKNGGGSIARSFLVACGEWSCVITRKACEDTDEPGVVP